MHGDEQTAKLEQMAASKAEVVQSWYCWTYPSSCPKNQACSTSPVLGRRALANATVVLARAHVLREKAVAARRVVEKLQDADPEFPFCGSSRQGRIATSFPGKHEWSVFLFSVKVTMMWKCNSLLCINTIYRFFLSGYIPCTALHFIWMTWIYCVCMDLIPSTVFSVSDSMPLSCHIIRFWEVP